MKSQEEREKLLKTIVATKKFAIVRDIFSEEDRNGKGDFYIQTVRVKRYAINLGIPGFKEIRDYRENIGNNFYQMFKPTVCKKPKSKK